MKHLFLAGSLMLAVASCPCLAQSAAAPVAAGDGTNPAPSAPHHLVFHPVAVDSGGVAPIQVGGGSRAGIAGSDITVEVLTPDQIALTTQAQPSLYWYQSKSTEAQCEVTLTEPKVAKPLLVLKTGKSTPPGIHAIRLSKFKVELKPDVVYKWSVAVVLDPASRSGDVVANGVIKRITPAPDLAHKLAAASDSDKAAIFAENGIWYDALQSISDQIDHSPNDKALRDERADLLRQVGLEGAQMESTAKAP
jgi:hypothetical protein